METTKNNHSSAKYNLVKESIQKKILSKEWPDGTRIPAESEFCEMFGVSRITIRRALDELRAMGYLETVQGRGTFVRNRPMVQRLSKFYSFSETLKQRGMQEQAIVIGMISVPAGSVLSEKLQVPEGTPVYKISRIRRTEHGPYAVEDSYIPVATDPALTAERINMKGLYKSLAEDGVSVNSAVETFRAINVNKEQSHLLEVRIDAAAIALTRTAYSGAVPVEYCYSIVRGDFFSYTAELS